MACKILIVGAAGRMGRRIVSLAARSERFKVVGTVERADHPEAGKDAGVVAGVEPVGVKLDSRYVAGADVVVDFSSPSSAEATLEYCRANNVGLVLGTTGLNERQRGMVESAAKKVGVVYASNMSVGMNVLFSLVGKVASMLGDDYDIEIVEQHHRFKKDAPSGSALTLAENICKATGRSLDDCIVCGRSGADAARQPGTIGIHAVRAGGITGVHSVVFASSGEKVELGHTAFSRDTFAAGALRAAEWLVGKKAGLYSMADVLGLD